MSTEVLVLLLELAAGMARGTMARTERLWKDPFRDRTHLRDSKVSTTPCHIRMSQRNPRAPDFRHRVGLDDGLLLQLQYILKLEEPCVIMYDAHNPGVTEP